MQRVKQCAESGPTSGDDQRGLRQATDVADQRQRAYERKRVHERVLSQISTFAGQLQPRRAIVACKLRKVNWGIWWCQKADGTQMTPPHHTARGGWSSWAGAKCTALVRQYHNILFPLNTIAAHASEISHTSAYGQSLSAGHRTSVNSRLGLRSSSSSRPSRRPGGNLRW